MCPLATNMCRVGSKELKLCDPNEGPSVESDCSSWSQQYPQPRHGARNKWKRSVGYQVTFCTGHDERDHLYHCPNFPWLGSGRAGLRLMWHTDHTASLPFLLQLVLPSHQASTLSIPSGSFSFLYFPSYFYIAPWISY